MPLLDEARVVDEPRSWVSARPHARLDGIYTQHFARQCFLNIKEQDQLSTEERDVERYRPATADNPRMLRSAGSRMQADFGGPRQGKLVR
jgi:hypothetical protein